MPQPPQSTATGFQYPCDYAIKAMGHNLPTFQALVIQLIAQHTGPIAPTQIQCNPSRNQQYLSVIVHIQAQSQTQLDAIYQDLTDADEVLMRL